jgi:hypothetical protein
MDGFWADEDYYGFHVGYVYDAPRVTLDRYTVYTPTRTLDVFNWLQYFTRDELAAELRWAGFVAEEWYGNVAGDPYDENAPEMAVVARLAG